MFSPFDRLPPEVCLSILESCDDTMSVFCLISASPHLYRVYASHSKRILSRILQSMVPGQLFREFCAVNETAQFLSAPGKHRDRPSETRIRLFLDEYFSNGGFEFPATVSSLTRAHRLHNRIMFFMQDYANKSTTEMTVLNRTRIDCGYIPLERPTVRETAQREAFELSKSETIRFYRAFLGFELYCRVFGPQCRRDPTGDIDDSDDDTFYSNHRPYYSDDDDHHFSAPAQYELFIGRMHVWQVEELLCVHQFFASLLQTALNEIGNDLEAAFEEVTVQGRDRTERHHEYGVKLGPDDLISLKASCFGKLFMFSSEFASTATSTLSRMTAQGLDYMYDVATSSKKRCCFLIRSNYTSIGTFIYDAINTRFNDFAPTMEAEQESNGAADDPMRANLGFSLVARESPQGHAWWPARFSESFLPLRAMAYVFWDSKTIRSQRMLTAFDMVQKMPEAMRGGRYLLSHTESVQGRLGNLKVRNEDFRRLEREYGYIENEYEPIEREPEDCAGL